MALPKGNIPWNKGKKCPNLSGKNNSFYGKHHTKKTKEKIRQAHLKTGHTFPSRIGISHTEATKKKIGEAHKGEKSCWYGKKLSEQTKIKMRQNHADYKGKNHPQYGTHPSEATRQKMSDNHADVSGKNNPNYRGGLTSIYELIRKLKEYDKWREAVFLKDNYTCQTCGDNKGGNLKAHHKKEFAIILAEFLKEYDQFSPYEDQDTLIRLAIKWQSFWDIGNGETHCEKCHIELHKKLTILRRE